MDRAKARLVREAIEEALEPVGIAFNAEIKIIGGMRFDADILTGKIEIAEIGADGNAVSKEAKAFVSGAALFDLEPTDLGRKFNQGGHVFEIVGLNFRAKKYPINCLRDDGGSYKFPADHIKRLLQTHAVAV